MDIPLTGSEPAGRRTLAVRCGVVPSLADGFVARPETAPGLMAALVPGAVIALVSARASQPGEQVESCGKTQLAICLAESLWRAGRVDLLAWINASSRASALAGLVEAAAAVGIDPSGPAEHIATRFAGWLAATTRPWLLVLDDLRDAAGLGGLWPHGPAGTVLITTRDQATVCGEGEPEARVFAAGAFSTREGLAYLMERLGDDPDQRHGAIDLALTLGGDPCALTHASAVVTTTTQTCRDYQHHYTKRAFLAAQQANGQPVTPAAVTWMLSAGRAGQLSRGGAARLVLALTALLDGQPVPGTAFTTRAVATYLADEGLTGADPDRAWAAVRALHHTGLLAIDRASEPPTVRMNRTTAAQARAAMPNRMLERAAHAAADTLLEIWPSHDPQPWQATGLRSCAAALQQTAGDSLWKAESCHPLLIKAGHSLDAARLTGPAARYWAELAATSERVLGPDSPHTLVVGVRLARALLAAGQALEAVERWQRVVAGHARLSGPEHPATIEARVNLGHAMVAAGQPENAVHVLGQSVGACERLRGPGHPVTLNARDELAAACQAAGHMTEAIAHYRRNLHDRERAHGPRHLETIAARERLASACMAGGRFKEAISLRKKALAERQRLLGDDHLDTINAKSNLAAACHAAGKIAAALQLHEQACADLGRVLGATHPHTLACRADLANAYFAAGRLADAATLARETLTDANRSCQRETRSHKPCGTPVGEQE